VGNENNCDGTLTLEAVATKVIYVNRAWLCFLVVYLGLPAPKNAKEGLVPV
jgi:hypothetical protein